MTDEVITETEKVLTENNVMEDDNMEIMVDDEMFFEGIEAGSFYAGMYQAMTSVGMPSDTCGEIILKYMDDSLNKDITHKSIKANMDIAEMENHRITV